MTDEEQIQRAIYRLIGVRRFRHRNGFGPSSSGAIVNYVELDLMTDQTFSVYFDGSRRTVSSTFPLRRCEELVQEGVWVEIFE